MGHDKTHETCPCRCRDVLRRRSPPTRRTRTSSLQPPELPHARRHALGHAPVAKLGVVRGNQAPDVADSLAGLKGRHDVEEGESARIQHAAGSARTSADSPVETAAEAAGRSLADIAISPQVSIYITDDIAAARDRERPHIAFYIGGMGVFYHQYMHRIGFGAEADRIRRAYLGRERERAAQLLTDEMVDAMTIIGSPRELIT